ncbi:hypothetical protein SMKI_11G0520 [Saccharomyces mikatae IFO 1815]|uniref:Probable serine/threonine-protein kinase KKQ8 n=1 Tax=Saccharomyces mikatae IFO 1815 TaxID=226126 RepID=A0AA35NDA5_SACMI|nr:uncharacterized protein SMKI_11G0520 [Saccharomyces mikatae IFO 1815]CAI4034606.1 hypothetical protein SMKI_11G0520 [Saccharomyces mikatae IFO 1815]
MSIMMQEEKKRQRPIARRVRSFSESFKCLFKSPHLRSSSPPNVTQLPYRSSSTSPKRSSKPLRRATISARLNPKYSSMQQRTYTLKCHSPDMPHTFKRTESGSSDISNRDRSVSDKEEGIINESRGNRNLESIGLHSTQSSHLRSPSISSNDSLSATTSSSGSQWAMDSLLDDSDNDVIPYRGSEKEKLQSKDWAQYNFIDNPDKEALHRATSYPNPHISRQFHHKGLYIRSSHPDEKSLESLPQLADAAIRCIIEQDGFKVYEDGSHEHNIKLSGLIAKMEKSNFPSTHRQGSLSRPKLGISLSGLFKHHKGECDIENALSLLPTEEKPEAIHEKITGQSSADGNGSSLTQKKEDYLKIVNPDASLGSDELKLINSLSNKIHKSLQNFLQEKNLKPEESISEQAPTFQEKYGHPVGVVGAGAYGEVKLCARSRTDKDSPSFDTYHDKKYIYYAVKEVKPKQDSDLEKFCTKITSEFIIGHSLSHYHKNGKKPAPNILKIFDILEDSSSFIEVMEFCPAGDLYSMLVGKSKSKGGLHPLEADCFMKQLLYGVKFMHNHGIAHCDLKPENILFYPHGLLKICDFGTSSVFQTAWERRVHAQKGIIGSEPYVAPEEFVDGEYYDPRLIDCWSCGVVYITMILGHYLWKIASREKDMSYDEFYKEMKRDSKFKIFEELKHVNSELATNRKIALYRIFQWEPSKRISVDQLLDLPWMRQTICCLIYDSA